MIVKVLSINEKSSNKSEKCKNQVEGNKSKSKFQNARPICLTKKVFETFILREISSAIQKICHEMIRILNSIEDSFLESMSTAKLFCFFHL